MSRKTLIAGIILVSILVSGSVSLNAQTMVAKKTDFGTEYYSESVRVINTMWNSEKDRIEKMSVRIAETLRSGRTVVWDCTAGHSNIYEVDPNLVCLPKEGMISAMEFSGQKATIDKLQKGDMIVTNYINEQTVAAHKRGVYIIGVTDAYFRHKSFPAQDNMDKKPNYQNLELEDISDEVFDSHMPGQIGLVNMPYIPEMKVGAGTGNFMIALYWLTVSEVSNKMKNPGALPLEYASKYYDTLMHRLNSINTTQKKLIWSTASKAAVLVGQGGHMWVESSPKSVYCDASGASMGLAFTNHFPADKMKKGDVVFVAEVCDSTDSRMVQVARNAKDKGAFVIAMGPSNQKVLKSIADVYFDNLSPEGYGLFSIPGHTNKIGLVGSLINCIMYGSFSAQMVEEMNKHGWYPKYYMSYNWGGSENGYFQWLRWCVDRAGF